MQLQVFSWKLFVQVAQYADLAVCLEPLWMQTNKWHCWNTIFFLAFPTM